MNTDKQSQTQREDYSRAPSRRKTTRGIQTIALLACFPLLLAFPACNSGVSLSSSGDQQVSTSTGDNTNADNGVDSDTVADSDDDAYSGVDNGGDYAVSIQAALAANCRNHDEADDYSWSSSEAVQIEFNATSIAVQGAGAIVDGTEVTITSSGTYIVSGVLVDGQVIVDADDDALVRLVLDGVDIATTTSAPIYIVSARKTLIVLADGSDNYVTDGDSYVFEDSEETEPDAAIFSKDDLTITGNGALTVNAHYQDGIASKDGLIIAKAAITLHAVDDGLRGRDYLIVKDGTLTIDAGGDGLKSGNDEDAARGYISIEAGVIDIVSGRDAIQAQTDVLIADGEIALSSGGGSNQLISESESAKGIKGGVNVIIEGGTLVADCADDAVHSNGGMAISGGSLAIASGDDAIHADAELEVNAAEINITRSYEGIESGTAITINSGDISIVASDDGFNIAGANAGPGMPGPWGGEGAASGDYYMYINGGYTVIEAAGDGIDVGGEVVMTGGTVIINGPTTDMNSALDHVSFTITGGVLVASSSAGMAQGPGQSSTQYSVLVTLGSILEGGVLFHVQTSEGRELLTFAPTKAYQSVVFSSVDLEPGATYDVYYGGHSTGTVQDGVYEDGTYTPGTKYTSFTVSGVVTEVGRRPGGRM